jgi:hypothetical protein
MPVLRVVVEGLCSDCIDSILQLEIFVKGFFSFYSIFLQINLNTDLKSRRGLPPAAFS